MRYAAVGVLPESGQPQKIWLLLAQRPAGSGEEESGEKSSEESGLIEFFLPDGRPITTLPAAQDVHDVRTQDGQRRYLALQDRTGGTCHYLSPTLQPLLAGGVPAAADKPCPALREGQPLRFTDAAGRTLRYSYTPQNGLTPLGEPLPGALVAQNANHFMLRLDASSKDEAANSPRYMAYDDSGTPMPDAVGFDGFEDQGCDAWRMLRDGQWRFFTKGGLLSQISRFRSLGLGRCSSISPRLRSPSRLAIPRQSLLLQRAPACFSKMLIWLLAHESAFLQSSLKES